MVTNYVSGLTFEQQEKLLILRQEQMKLDLELQQLALIRAGRRSASALNEELVSSRFDVASNLLLPKFNENDIDQGSPTFLHLRATLKK